MAEDKVVLLKQDQTEANENVVNEVVADLEHLLDQAKCGKLHAIAFAGVTDQGVPTRGWAKKQGQASRDKLAAAIGDLFFSYYGAREDLYETTFQAEGNNS